MNIIIHFCPNKNLFSAVTRVDNFCFQSKKVDWLIFGFIVILTAATQAIFNLSAALRLPGIKSLTFNYTTTPPLI